MLDGPGGQGRRRAVDVTTESYEVARKYMVRLGPRDFEDESWVAALARAGGFSTDAFRTHFARMRPA
jgi:6-phosphofructokinase 1